jgi:ABC-type branched-subunit amino acid transport system substrate-binding protein
LIKIDAVDALVVGCSGEILQIADTIEKNKIPTMVVFASHPRVKHLGPYVFRVFMDLDRDIPKVAQKIKEDGRRRVAILTEELPFTLGIKDVLKKELKETLVTTPDYDLPPQLVPVGVRISSAVSFLTYL